MTADEQIAVLEGQPLADQLAIIRRGLAETELSEFCRQAWHVVEPSTVFVPGWHLDAICEHLEAVTRGEIRNLVITMPPRHMKSLAVAVFWPCWEWTRAPWRRWLFSSYSLRLSIRDSIKCRRLIESPWYQRNWSGGFHLTSDQNEKSRFENNRTGYRLATSVGGSATGDGGDRVIVDDAHNVAEGESETMRLAALDWWDGTMSTRGNDPKTVARVIVQQRVHEQDLAGHVLEQGGYELLKLPAEYEGEKIATGIGWSDPRTEVGELLWPERFGRTELDALKRELGSYRSSGQLQQRPAPAGGGLFKRHHLPIVEAGPADAVRVRYWDKASLSGDGDYSAGVLIARSKGNLYYVEDVVRGQWSPGERDRVIRQVAESDGHRVLVHIEQEKGSAGKDSAQSIITKLAGYAAYADPVTGEKVTRMRPLAAQAEAGNVKLVKGEWNAAFLDELLMIPAGRYDDQADAAAGAFNRLAPFVVGTATNDLQKIRLAAGERPKLNFFGRPLKDGQRGALIRGA